MKYLEKDCKARRENYEKQCSNIQGYEKNSIDVKKCKFEDFKFSQSGTVHKGLESMADGSRDKIKSIAHDVVGTSSNGSKSGTGK